MSLSHSPFETNLKGKPLALETESRVIELSAYNYLQAVVPREGYVVRKIKLIKAPLSKLEKSHLDRYQCYCTPNATSLLFAQDAKDALPKIAAASIFYEVGTSDLYRFFNKQLNLCLIDALEAITGLSNAIQEEIIAYKEYKPKITGLDFREEHAGLFTFEYVLFLQFYLQSPNLSAYLAQNKDAYLSLQNILRIVSGIELYKKKGDSSICAYIVDGNLLINKLRQMREKTIVTSHSSDSKKLEEQQLLPTSTSKSSAAMLSLEEVLKSNIYQITESTKNYLMAVAPSKGYKEGKIKTIKVPIPQFPGVFQERYQCCYTLETPALLFVQNAIAALPNIESSVIYEVNTDDIYNFLAKQLTRVLIDSLNSMSTVSDAIKQRITAYQTNKNNIQESRYQSLEQYYGFFYPNTSNYSAFTLDDRQICTDLINNEFENLRNRLKSIAGIELNKKKSRYHIGEYIIFAYIADGHLLLNKLAQISMKATAATDASSSSSILKESSISPPKNLLGDTKAVRMFPAVSSPLSTNADRCQQESQQISTP